MSTSRSRSAANMPDYFVIVRDNYTLCSTVGQILQVYTADVAQDIIARDAAAHPDAIYTVRTPTEREYALRDVRFPPEAMGEPGALGGIPGIATHDIGLDENEALA